MLSLLDIAERTQTGPKMSEMDWNMGLYNKMTELAKRYDIVVPKEIDWFNADDGLAERAFYADAAGRVGGTCRPTGSVGRVEALIFGASCAFCCA